MRAMLPHAFLSIPQNLAPAVRFVEDAITVVDNSCQVVGKLGLTCQLPCFLHELFLASERGQFATPSFET